jgi:3',5'-cyclic AMP phosphodiesterase CpdA
VSSSASTGAPQNRGAAGNGEVEVVVPQVTDVVLGRPTDTSVVLNVLAVDDVSATVAYGTSADALSKKTSAVSVREGQPHEVTLEALDPNTRYYYTLQDSSSGKALVRGTFHTQRNLGGSFTFEVMGDSHPERRKQFDPDLYAQMLRSIAADQPDFLVMSGDDFSVDTLKTINAETVAQRYELQRPYLSLVGRSAPVFLVNGNHEQAARVNLDGTADNVAVWAQNSRNSFFSQPAPDGFYTGDAEKVEHIGLLRDYYAWEWGDALFVVIDPYWHSKVTVDNPIGGQGANGKQGKTGASGGQAKRKQQADQQQGNGKTSDKWSITLGDAQYAWLQKTLESSDAKHKFVFSHHVLGTGRGGVELAGLYEWGGKNAKGVDEFAAKRPGWDLPIHQLMAKNGVSVFFQGHDHVWATQKLDGVVYQELPNPADPNYASDQAKAYRTGDVLPSSGRARVTVSGDKVRVEYVRSYLPKDAITEHPDGEVAYSYEIRRP